MLAETRANEMNDERSKNSPVTAEAFAQLERVEQQSAKIDGAHFGDVKRQTYEATVSRNAPQIKLTERQTTCLQLLANGASNKEIEEKMTLSSRRVNQHISAICKRLNAHTREHAVALAVQAGLINVENRVCNDQNIRRPKPAADRLSDDPPPR